MIITMNIEQTKTDIKEVLKEIFLTPKDELPEKELKDQYIALINKVTFAEPSPELANFGMNIMHDISNEICAAKDEARKSWLSELSTATCAYFRFDESAEKRDSIREI